MEVLTSLHIGQSVVNHKRRTASPAWQSSGLQQLLQNKLPDHCQVPCVILTCTWKDVLKLLKSFIAASIFQCKTFFGVESSSGDEAWRFSRCVYSSLLVSWHGLLHQRPLIWTTAVWQKGKIIYSERKSLRAVWIWYDRAEVLQRPWIGW